MTRDQLKKIIKECLVEILVEGAGQEAITERASRHPRVPSFASPPPTARNRAPAPPPRRQTVYDMMQVGQGQAPPQRSHINNLVSTATKDPIMASILADTAQTTLIEQDTNGRVATSGGDQAARVISAYDPTEIFGEEATMRWNEAAFAPKNRLPGFSLGC